MGNRKTKPLPNLYQCYRCRVKIVDRDEYQSHINNCGKCFHCKQKLGDEYVYYEKSKVHVRCWYNLETGKQYLSYLTEPSSDSDEEK